MIFPPLQSSYLLSYINKINKWDLFNPNYARHCSAFTVSNGHANVQQWLCQAYSPPPRCDAFFPNAALPLFPLWRGGMFLCVRSFVIQSEAMNLLLFPARFLTVFGMTKGVICVHSRPFAKFAFGYRVPGITINHWQLTIELCQAYSPPQEWVLLFPQRCALGWINAPFQGFYSRQ